jgi:UDP-N-acetylmuramate dehydrogenase
MSLQLSSKAHLSRNVPLASYTTFKVGGVAQYFSEPTTCLELSDHLMFAHNTKQPVLVLGRGSNLLFADSGFRGLVIHMRKFGSDQLTIREKLFVSVSAGVGLFRLNLFCQNAGLSGAEFLCHIPGTVGGAIQMNAGFGRKGTLHREIKDILHSIRLMDFKGLQHEISKSDIKFSYRNAQFPIKGIVLEAIFVLTARSTQYIKNEIYENFRYRNLVQDLSHPSAGSIFKNVCNYPKTSGQLLDAVGMRGVCVGGAMISRKHANFILNMGEAKASDILALMKMSQKRVFDEFGVQLKPEIRYISDSYETQS